MPLQTLTDATFARKTRRAPVLILLSTGGDKLRSDFKTAFVKPATKKRASSSPRSTPDANPQLRERFDYQSKALLIGWHRGETLLRRSRPWSSDLPDFIQQLHDAREAAEPPARGLNLPKLKRKRKVLAKPLDVSDATFEKEAIAASNDLPVLVDFGRSGAVPVARSRPFWRSWRRNSPAKSASSKWTRTPTPGSAKPFRSAASRLSPCSRAGS